MITAHIEAHKLLAPARGPSEPARVRAQKAEAPKLTAHEWERWRSS